MKRTTDALPLFTSQTEVARLLEVSPAAVSQWIAAGRVPTKRALEVRARLEHRADFDADAYLRLIVAEMRAAEAA